MDAQPKTQLSPKQTTVARLQECNQALGGDSYLTLKLKHLPPDYQYVSGKSDNELLAEALWKQYGK